MVHIALQTNMKSFDFAKLLVPHGFTDFTTEHEYDPDKDMIYGISMGGAFEYPKTLDDWSTDEIKQYLADEYDVNTGTDYEYL